MPALPDRDINLSYYALAKVDSTIGNGSSIILTGGYDSTRKNSAKAFTFNVGDPDTSANAAWATDLPQPDMNVARSHHSSCALSSKVYVLCGFNESEEIDSVEMLDTAAMDSSQ